MASSIPTQTPTRTAATDRHASALTEALARLNTGDLDRYLAIYDDAAVVHGLGPEPLSKPALREFYTALLVAFPGFQVETHEVFGEDDRVTCRFTLSGTHGGDFMGVPATGRPITLPGITVLHFRDDRCVERWSSSDVLGLLVQIGAVPPPA
jgi:steroid delta-isomerase-like uncharacterized protein